jgi:hypothetical protein
MLWNTKKRIGFSASFIRAVHPKWEKVMLRSMVSVVLLAVGGTTFAAEPSLFKQRVQQQALITTGQRAYAVEIDRTALRAATVAGGLRIDFPGGKSVFARMLRQETMPDDNLVWVGTVSLPKEDRNVVITMGRDAVFGSLVTADGNSIELETRKGVTRLVIRDPRFDAQRLFAQKGVSDYVVPDTDVQAQVGGPVRAHQALAAASPPRVDLLLGYTPGIVARYGSDSAARTRMSFLTALTNQALQDSKVAGRMRLVGTIKVDYPDTNRSSQVLDALADTSGNGPLQAMRDARRALGADLMAFIRPFLTPEHGNCGLAPVNGSNLSPYTAAAAGGGRAAVSDGHDDDSGFFCNDATLAHELGHTMGLVHETTESDSPGPFPYTYGWTQELPDNRGFNTLMAYGTSTTKTVFYYANPNIYYCSAMPCGDPGIADQTRALNQVMPIVAAFNEPGNPVADLDGNGNADLVVQNATEVSVMLYSNGSVLSGLIPYRLPLPAGQQIITMGDLDGDLRSELILNGAGTTQYAWFRDAGGTTSSRSLPDRAAGDTLVTTADLSGDGRADLLFVNPSSRKFTWWRMNGATRQSVQTLDIAAGAFIAAVGDFDGDRRIDLMWTSPARDLTFWKNTGSGFTQAAAPAYAAGWSVVGSGHIDSDSRADLVLTNTATGQIENWLMNGATRISVTTLDLPTGYRVVSVDRYSGSSASVFLTSNARDGTLWQNNGDGTFLSKPDRYVFSVGGSCGCFSSYPAGWSIVSALPRQP